MTTTLAENITAFKIYTSKITYKKPTPIKLSKSVFYYPVFRGLNL